jgi:hypothetical protein
MEKLVRLGVSEREYREIQANNKSNIDSEIWELDDVSDSWNDYILWDYHGDTYVADTQYGDKFVPWNKKRNHYTVMHDRREMYYQSYTWAHRRNAVLYDANFVCAGCGGVATQAHHHDDSAKFGNYAKIGHHDEDVEKEILVPLCIPCHRVITNIQNPKRRITTPRTLEIKLPPHRVPEEKPQINMFDTEVTQ